MLLLLLLRPGRLPLQQCLPRMWLLLCTVLLILLLLLPPCWLPVVLVRNISTAALLLLLLPHACSTSTPSSTLGSCSAHCCCPCSHTLLRLCWLALLLCRPLLLRAGQWRCPDGQLRHSKQQAGQSERLQPSRLQP
jgi:hypothetical protein